MPLYLAEMESLGHKDPLIHEEFMSGNWVVNKNDVVPFCAIGVDTALENVNRSLKVNGGLVGITLNPSARNKFFLVSPYLTKQSCLIRSQSIVNEGITNYVLVF